MAHSRCWRSVTLVALAFTVGGPGTVLEAQQVEAGASGYRPATTGTRVLEAPGGLSLRVLVEASNLDGDEVELAEITFPPGAGGGRRGHTHGRVEILYVLSGTLDHIVDGASHILEPGSVGIVRPGDEVVHRVVGEEPVRALVVWAPGGELERIAPGFEERPPR